MKNRNLLFLVNALFIIVLSLTGLSAQDIPDRPNPPRLINDFANMFSEQESAILEQKLVTFNDSTSTQIAIVTVTSLSGYDIMDYAENSANRCRRRNISYFK